jgi:PKD repeat protein
MIQEFRAVDQSTIWDVCNNTYGTADLIVKLMTDNGFPNINTYPENGQLFLYDDTLVVNQNLKQTNAGLLKYATRERTTTNEENMKYYEQILEDQYMASADGETVIVRPALIGNRIVQIEKEIKPLYDADFLFNPASGSIALQGGLTLDAGQTLFIIYAVIIQS